MLRTADAAGADGVIFAGGSVDPYNSKCVRASAGSLFHLPVVLGAPLDEAVLALRGAGLRILAADGTARHTLDEAAPAARLRQPAAWLFGNEAWGLPADVLALADEAVAVPIYGRAESLNLAAAAAVCLYASARAQRRAGLGPAAGPGGNFSPGGLIPATACILRHLGVPHGIPDALESDVITLRHGRPGPGHRPRRSPTRKMPARGKPPGPRAGR